jgi:hypothetical protein
MLSANPANLVHFLHQTIAYQVFTGKLVAAKEESALGRISAT